MNLFLYDHSIVMVLYLESTVAPISESSEMARLPACMERSRALSSMLSPMASRESLRPLPLGGLWLFVLCWGGQIYVPVF